jgi:hypothetical protein
MNNYFEIEYRGLRAAVEPANGLNRWEMCFLGEFGEGNDWFPVGCGDYPAVNLDTARAAAVERCKKKHPEVLAGLYRERAALQKRITAMEAR